MEPKAPHATHSLVQTIRNQPDFSALDDESLLSLVGESMNLFWKSGSTVFTAGSSADALYVVLSGECSIRDGDDGEEVAHPGPGDSFGEMSILLNTKHTRSAFADTDCELLVLPKEAFTELLGQNPLLNAHFREVLKKRDPDRIADAVDQLDEPRVASA
ncbi:MAG TPA: cyclic nucleotide-binding domain-containing protein [Actinomycetota bacterium]|nr:cyclic nucleotide-binding domain-containing protein [Actinomycetota bacterium]